MANKELQYQEDEIDLRQLMCILLASKKLIVITTVIITLLAGIYAFTKTPVYEAGALVKIGNYKTYKDTISLDSAPELAKKLNVVFTSSATDNGTSKGTITEISASAVNTHINITAQALSNESAAQKINELVNFIKTGHQQDLDEIKRQRELEIQNSINNIDREINKIIDHNLSKVETNIEHFFSIELASIDRKIGFIKKTQLPDLTLKIKSFTQRIEKAKETLKQNYQNLKALESTPALAFLRLTEIQLLENEIFEHTNTVIDLKTTKSELSINRLKDLEDAKTKLMQIKLPQLESEKNQIENDLERLVSEIESLLLAEQHYKNSAIVGEFATSNTPIKPKKELIIAVAFIAGLMLSIFLVFILNAFKGPEDEKTTE